MSRKQVVFGLHAARSVVARSPERVLGALVVAGTQSSELQSLVRDLQALGIKPQFCPAKTLHQHSDGGNHQGVVLQVTAGRQYQEQDLPELCQQAGARALFLILDQVTDPHNLGACLRTADAAGVTAVVVPKDKSASLTPTVSKVASGAAETVPLVQVTNLARAMRDLQQSGVWLIGTAGEATQDLYQVTHQGPLGLVMGAEGKGMRRLTREHCDELVAIPLYGQVSSLNVSVASGVCLYEFVRQRRAEPK